MEIHRSTGKYNKGNLSSSCLYFPKSGEKKKKNPLSLQKLPFSALFCVLFLFVIEPGPPRPAGEPLGLLVLVIELKKKTPKNHMGIRAGEGMKEEIIGGIHGWISYCPN